MYVVICEVCVFWGLLGWEDGFLNLDFQGVNGGFEVSSWLHGRKLASIRVL